ncbi:MAG TPA: patatin-like phospholipase family protein [Baekduia sp.]|nr:patatin-like phospholipase family protein [Baekduia sp.]
MPPLPDPTVLRPRLATAQRAGRFDEIATLLRDAARAAMKAAPRPREDGELAELCSRYQQFGYARQLYRRLYGPPGVAVEDRDRLRELYAGAAYQDLELPSTRRFARALEILRDEGYLDGPAAGAEAFGVAGDIHQRRFDDEARADDLRQARAYYGRGRARQGDRRRLSCAVNEAFVLDVLADGADDVARTALRAQADAIRGEIRAQLGARPVEQLDWRDRATLAEAAYGLRDFPAARALLDVAERRTQPPWELEATARRLGRLARLRGFGATAGAGHAGTSQFSASGAGQVLDTLLDGDASAVTSAYQGKVGLALSGGGYRASLFHIGVLAALAERDVLRHVEALSCVSGGSILGAFYYLALGRLLTTTEDHDITQRTYSDLVRQLADDFLAGVKKDLRGQLSANLWEDAKMVTPLTSRTDRAADLFDEHFYSTVSRWQPGDGTGAWTMPDLMIEPAGRGPGFSPRYENWRRTAKVPVLVINATSMNTGRTWQFTASWMGEPPDPGTDRVNANPRLRRMYYADAPEGWKRPRLADAVAASASVPLVFPPLRLDGVYPGYDVALADGGVHDNQGIASLLEQDCSVVLVSDASGQLEEDKTPMRNAVAVALRTKGVLMSRVRGLQLDGLELRLHAGSVRAVMTVHLKKGLASSAVDWIDGPEDHDSGADEPTSGDQERREAYKISEDAQRALAAMRTDLDAFSDDEAYSLMAAGYRMTMHELALALHDFALAEPQGPTRPWPFLAAMDRIARDFEPGDDFAVSLRVGAHGFGRPLRKVAARAGALLRTVLRG